jgi:8-oxo-dGTP diphosphatase
MTVVAVVAVITNGSMVLGVSRKDNHNDFGLPGGKVEPGETPEQAILREVKEETGLDAEWITRLDFTYPGRPEHVATFLVKHLGEPICGEGAAVKWCTKDELMSGSFGQYNRTLFNFLGWIS